MKNKKLIVALSILLVVALAVTIVYNADIFKGERVKNPDAYTLDFELMNQTDTFQMELKDGDELAVDFAIDFGIVDLIIAKDGEEPVYKGNHIHSAVFDLGIEKGGVYTITVKAHYAKGFVHLYNS